MGRPWRYRFQFSLDAVLIVQIWVVVEIKEEACYEERNFLSFVSGLSLENKAKEEVRSDLSSPLT